MDYQYSNALLKLSMHSRCCIQGLFLLVLCCFSARCLAGDTGVVIKRAELTVKNNWVLLDADIDFQLSPVVFEVLRNGVYLQWTLQVKVYRQRRYIWDRKLTDKKRRFRIRHHALMKMYQLTNLSNGKVDYYVTLAAALQAMGTIKNMLLIEQGKIQQDGQYFATVAVKFDRDMLPVPLQPIAFFNPEWLLSSNLYLCSLKK